MKKRKEIDYWKWNKSMLIDEILMLQDALGLAVEELQRSDIRRRAYEKRLKSLDQFRAYVHN